MEEKVRIIIEYLNRVKTRCTYGVVAKILGVNSKSVGMYLGKHRPEVSWVVNAKTGHPTGYSDSEKHLDLYCTDRIIRIKSAETLRKKLGV